MNRVKYYISIYFTFVSIIAFGQDTSLKKAQIPLMLPNRVFIKSDHFLYYSVSYDNSHWINTKISSTAYFDSWKMGDIIYIKVITTTLPPKIYQLLPDNYYSIDWDDKQLLWVVHHIVH